MLASCFKSHESNSDMSQFKHAGVICKPNEPRVNEILAFLLPYLSARDIKISLDAETTESVSVSGNQLARETLATECDLFIIIGGDGTFLGASRTLVHAGKPLIGINAGRLGFLVDIWPEQIASQLGPVLDGKYHLEDRILLTANIMRNGETISSDIALNDISLHMRDTIRMIEFHTRIDRQSVHTLRADGLIVSTPTGSTAYSLSAGGPVLHPELDVLLVAPICPHTLSSRPIVIKGNSVVEIELLPDCEVAAIVSFDGQNTANIEPADVLQIQRLEKTLQVLHPLDYNYFEVLRSKLHWSEQL